MGMIKTHHGINSLPRGGGGIDPDIIILQDWVTPDVGLQPTGGIPASLSTRFDPDGPLDVSGTGWSGTPYVSAQDLGWVTMQSSDNFVSYAARQYRYENGVAPYEFYTQGVDFTFEAWLRHTADRGNLSSYRSQPLIGLFNNSTNICIGLWDSGIGFYDYNGRGVAQYTPLRGWHHYAVVVHNNIANIYVDGVIFGSGYPVEPSAMTSFIIAKRYNIKYAGSWIDMANYDYAQVCLTKRAKWTENFTPPTRPYCLGME